MSTECASDWDQFLDFTQDAYARCEDTRYADFQDLLDDALVGAPLSPIESSIGSPSVSSTSEELPPEGSSTVNVSTSFSFTPCASTDPGRAPDVILFTSDCVRFYVHACHLLGASSNGFGGLLSSNVAPPTTPGALAQPTLVLIPESSPTVNVLLNAIYQRSCIPFLPSIADLTEAVGALARYGLSDEVYLAPGAPLHTALLALLPAAALSVYAIAATHDARTLAAIASTHLLAYPLAALTDAAATDIGPVYLKRLFFLHLGRVEALKRLLVAPPAPHTHVGPSRGTCTVLQEKALARAWALAAACLVWDARADTAAADIICALGTLEQHTTCIQCRTALHTRVRAVVAEWAEVKTTICF